MKTWAIILHHFGVFDTSRKLCQKESQPKLVAVLLTSMFCNPYMTVDLFFFGLTMEILEIWELVIFRCKGFENNMPIVYHTPLNLLKSQLIFGKEEYRVV